MWAITNKLDLRASAPGGIILPLYAGVVQLVECLLAKEKVTGSSPVARFVFG
jgi:hypothetical protein